MKYKYTLYQADGSSKEVGEFKKQLSFKDTKTEKGLYTLLGCSIIEIIPDSYYPDIDQKSTVTYYGDEEGRFVEGYQRNQHMKTLFDHRGNVWDVVGTVIREEKISERTRKS